MGTTKSGYEGILLYGVPGATASNQILNCEDLEYDTSPEKAPTTVRGTGSTPPINTEKVVALNAKITWSMLLKTGDTILTALIAAERTGAAVALRTKSYSTGLGFDGDCTLSVKHSMTLNGQSKFDFEATPTDDEGRAPLLNA